MSLSGRVDSIETQIAFILQDLLRKTSIDTIAEFSSTWNQQFDTFENKLCESEADLQELQVLYANLALDLEGAIDNANSQIVQKSFETVSENLSQYPYELYYSTGEDLTGVHYTIDATGYIDKSLEYSPSGLLIRVSLTGSPVPSVTLNKQLLYSGDTLTGAYYY